MESRHLNRRYGGGPVLALLGEQVVGTPARQVAIADVQFFLGVGTNGGFGSAQGSLAIWPNSLSPRD